MNRMAAIPLTISTGRYWLMESSTAGDCLAKTGAGKPKGKGVELYLVTARGTESDIG
jgi:hypothetical protein